MSLYNMIHGFNQLAGILIAVLDLDLIDIGRFRDAALYNKDMKEGQYLIRITTRTGGHNRDEYKESIDMLIKHEHFIREENDSFDPTYMYFFFRVPPGMEKFLDRMVNITKVNFPEVVDNRSLKEKTDTAIEKLQESAKKI